MNNVLTEKPIIKEKGFLLYFIEIRKIVIQLSILFLMIFLSLAPFSAKIYSFLALPLQLKLPPSAHMIATDVTSTFLSPFKLVFFITLILLMPFIFYKVYSFLNTALHKKERWVLFLFFMSSVILFYLGILIGYYFILPKVLSFFMGIAPDVVLPMTDINQYLMFSIKLFVVLGVVFQLPLITVLAVYFNLIDLNVLKQKRSFIFVFCFFIAMFITPPDMLSMAIAGCFMYFLFELGLLISFILFRNTETE